MIEMKKHRAYWKPEIKMTFRFVVLSFRATPYALSAFQRSFMAKLIGTGNLTTYTRIPSFIQCAGPSATLVHPHRAQVNCAELVQLRGTCRSNMSSEAKLHLLEEIRSAVFNVR